MLPMQSVPHAIEEIITPENEMKVSGRCVGPAFADGRQVHPSKLTNALIRRTVSEVLQLDFGAVNRPADRLEYLPAGFKTPAAQLAQAQPTPAPEGSMQFDFSNETVRAEPKSFLSVVGFWTIGAEGDNKFLVVDGRRWKQGQPAANLADKARAIYGVPR